MAISFGTSSALTITAGSLASAAARSSAAVTTSTSINVIDIQITVNILTTSTAPSGNKQVIVYGYSSEDGTNYSSASSVIDNVDGTDKTLTAIGTPSILKRIGTIPLQQGANAVTIRQTFSIVSAFGFIPEKWGVVLYNDAGTALGATVSVTYSEVSYS